MKAAINLPPLTRQLSWTSVSVPTPSLPSQGVLITPYATAWIGIPFLMFFGMIWSVFLYVGVYLLFIRLPQIRKAQAKLAP